MITVDPTKAVELAAEAVREERDKRIECCDWVVTRYRDEVDTPGVTPKLTLEQYQAVLIYRQALRDISSQTGFPLNVEWPVLDSAVCAATQQCYYQAPTA